MAVTLIDTKSALVTGATGYIGSRLVGGLLANGWQVSVVIRPSSSQQLLQPYLHRVTCYIHDGSMDKMIRTMDSVRPAVVYHLAALASSEHKIEDVERLVNTNVLFSTQLVEAMLRCGVRNLVNTETFWQHYEGDAYNPVCLYAATKQAFLDILRYYVSTKRISAISLVLYDTYGPDDPRMKLFVLLKQTAQSKQQIDMTPGEQIVDMTHIEDVVAAYLRAGEMLLSERCEGIAIYAVTSGQRMKLRKLVELFIRETGISLQPNWGGRPYRAREVMEPWIGQPLPGWWPKIDLTTGIRDVFNKKERDK